MAVRLWSVLGRRGVGGRQRFFRYTDSPLDVSSTALQKEDFKSISRQYATCSSSVVTENPEARFLESWSNSESSYLERFADDKIGGSRGRWNLQSTSPELGRLQQSLFHELRTAVKNCDRRKPENVEKMLHMWEGKVSSKMLTTLLRSTSSLKVATAVFRWAESRVKFTPNEHHYNALMYLASRNGDFVATESFWQEMIAKNVPRPVTAYNNYMACCGRAGMLDEACRIFAQMKEENVSRNIATYNIMIQAFKGSKISREAMLTGALDAFEMMKAEGLKPNQETFNSLLALFGKAKKLDFALEVFDEMNAASVHPDIITFNTIIDILGKAGRLKEAMDWLKKMRSFGVSPDPVTYASIIDGLGKTGKTFEALALFRQIKEEGVTPNIMTFTTVISICGKAGLINEALELFEEMKAHGIPPDDWTYGVMMDACKKAHMPKKLVEFAEASKRAGFELTYWEKNMAIAAYGALRNTKEVDAMALEVRSQADPVTWITVLDTYNKLGLFEKAKAFNSYMRAARVKPTLRVFGALIQTYSGLVEVESAFHVLEEMRMAGIEPDVVNYGMIIALHMKVGRLQKAVEIYNEMRGRGLKPNQFLYNMAIHLFGNLLTESEKAIEVYSEMLESGMKPDRVTCNTLEMMCAKYQWPLAYRQQLLGRSRQEQIRAD